MDSLAGEQANCYIINVMATNTAKLLIVDDVDVVLRLEEILLKRTGCDVFKAKDGAEALRIVQTERPNIVVMDLIMPEMNGDVVCRFIKGNPELKDTCVVIVTSKGEKEYEQRCRQAGADHFVTKPIRHNELLDLIRQELRVRGFSEGSI